MANRKPVTQSDIARACNVSRVTVSHVLNNREGTWISEEMRRRIIDAAMNLNYEIKSRSEVKNRFIGLVIPHVASEINLRLMNGVILAADRKNYIVATATTAHDPAHEREVVQNLVLRDIDGLVISPALRSREDVAQGLYSFAEFSVPIVCVDACCEYFDTASVVFDYRKAAKELTRVYLEAGHKKIGFLHYFKGTFHPGCELRCEGYQDALRERGIAPDHSLIQYPADRRHPSIELEVRSLVKAGATAIIAQTDYLAIQVINELRELGLNVPRDMRVAGFDNLTAGQVHHPSITTLEEPWERMGEAASDLLLRMIDSGRKSSEKIMLSAEVVQRES